MASAFRRNLRSTSRLISNSLNYQWRSSKSPIHTLSDNLLHHNSPRFAQSTVNQHEHRLLRAFLMNNRQLLCTTSTNPVKVNQSGADTTPSGGSAAEGGSGSSGGDGGKDTGGSESSSQQGKSNRGGPVSWLSFFLLVCTGAGLVYYYDREKKRHIQG